MAENEGGTATGAATSTGSSDPNADANGASSSGSSSDDEDDAGGKGRGRNRGDDDGVRADLARERRARQAAERERDDLRKGQMTEQEKAVAEAKDTATKEALVKANERILRSEVKALAGTKLADPMDAVRLLDLSRFEVDDDGNVDEKAIASAIDALVKTKPYLAATARPGPLPGSSATPANGEGSATMDDWLRGKARK